MKNIYFLSDAHLGSLAVPHRRQQERRLVRFLDEVKERAQAIYLMGDMFDFWFEYRTVVPRGFTRFLGKVSELTDMGVEVHYFLGNHDMWCTDYLEQECGVILHREPITVELADRVFFLAHGDGLGRESAGEKFLHRLFHSKLGRKFFASLHPRWGVSLALLWAAHSRRKHDAPGGEPPYMGEDREPLVLFAKKYLQDHPEVNYFLFGHRHIELDLMLSRQCRMMILGDWVTHFTYAVFDGETLFMENYAEGEDNRI